ncbi:MAG: glycosyltransferase [Dehalococcoidia bacterium]|nr:glycosyltransferase [Dehalococcoidia bacterium]
MAQTGDKCFEPQLDGTIYSARKNLRPFSVPPLEEYTRLLGLERIERLLKAAERLKGLRILEMNATARGGGVAEMLFSAIPFMNDLGLETEWNIITGNPEYYECTKVLHNLLQGKRGFFTQDMVKTYDETINRCAAGDSSIGEADVVLIHDPQPAGLSRYVKRPGQVWAWRCHIDIEEYILQANPGLETFISNLLEPYDAAIFTAAHYVITKWRLPKFLIPPFIDPLSEKNRDLSEAEINAVLDKYGIDRQIPTIVQVGRFDPWKGLERTIEAFKVLRKKRECQLLLAGGLAADDPEGVRVLSRIRESTKDDQDIHILNLSLEDRLENWREVNALQRAADIIMQPSTREGFGLVITEALWKGKPVIGADVGAIPLQLRDGDTGYFYRTPRKTARIMARLLDNPAAAAAMGKNGKDYVTQHFLMPDRIADWLMAVNLLVEGRLDKEACGDAIISFHPWFKLGKR